MESGDKPDSMRRDGLYAALRGWICFHSLHELKNAVTGTLLQGPENSRTALKQANYQLAAWVGHLDNLCKAPLNFGTEQSFPLGSFLDNWITQIEAILPATTPVQRPDTPGKCTVRAEPALILLGIGAILVSGTDSCGGFCTWKVDTLPDGFSIEWVPFSGSPSGKPPFQPICDLLSEGIGPGSLESRQVDSGWIILFRLPVEQSASHNSGEKEEKDVLRPILCWEQPFPHSVSQSLQEQNFLLIPVHEEGDRLEKILASLGNQPPVLAFPGNNPPPGKMIQRIPPGERLLLSIETLEMDSTPPEEAFTLLLNPSQPISLSLQIDDLYPAKIHGSPSDRIAD